MDSSLIDDLQSDFPDQITGIETLPEKEGSFVPAEAVLPDSLSRSLGFNNLYKHQAQAISELKQGSNVCLTTGTDSGKTLVYALYSAIKAKEKNETTLCIYPTKALSRDQQESLEQTFSQLGLSLKVGTYDGDTDKDKKRHIRQNADVILTNFQGLNYYLPHHGGWEDFFSRLGLIVIDESHMYTGVMGSHVAWIIRRLLRVVEGPYNADPQIILTTATLGNPREHAETLTGRVITTINTDTSPQSEKHVILWNPKRSDGQRESPHRTTTKVAPWLVNRTASQILIFTPSRRTTELCMRWIQEETEKYKSDITVESYHAGHSKKARRKTEERIKSGNIDITISTTALEVGIDIGDLDIVICDTYPRSRTSFWQQVGRAGRENSEALTFFIANKTSVDQYIIDNPSYLLEDGVEDAIIDLTNTYISSKHITTAASEHPLTQRDQRYFTESLDQITSRLREKNILDGSLDTGMSFRGSYRPESKISIYSTSASGFNVKIVSNSGETKANLPEVSRTRAYRELYPNATYLHRGTKYQVDKFIETDSKKEIHLKRSDNLDYYTQSHKQKQITNVKETESQELGYGMTLHKGRIIVKEHYLSYSKIYESDEQAVHDIPTGLEDSIDLKTDACWITFDETISKELAERTGGNLLGSLHGAEHALIELSPTLLNIDVGDLGGLSARAQPNTKKPTIFIYDGVNGGIGYSYRIYQILDQISEIASNRITNCDCTSRSGCLECIMSPNCGSENDPLHKKGSAMITEILSRLSPD